MRSVTGSAGPWASRAMELAEFTQRHLVNRADVWGAYLPFDRREMLPDGKERKIWTAPRMGRRGIEQLTARQLERHYIGRDVGHIVGLHSTSPTNTSRWLVFDLDNHEASEAQAEENEAACARLVATLAEFRLTALVEDSNGDGGRHVWVIFHEPAPTRQVHAFAEAVVAELGLSCETYPKQAAIPPERFGNWMRLPGRHHTREHWSRFLAGGEWHEGADAVELWLCAWLSDAAHLPIPGERPAAVLPLAPRSHAGSTDVDRRVRAYMTKLPTGLGAGEGRNDAGYQFSCFLVRDLALADDTAFAWLVEWNAAHRTPMTAGKLRDLIGDAHRYGNRAPGVAV